ncbi:MAG: HEAT repeat domain-containing protein, partial [bacterium]|nr:HEAT repeat domain-containing protein [bacterium]
LGELKVKKAVKPLETLLKQERWLHVRIAAARALGKIGDPTASLFAALSPNDEPKIVAEVMNTRQILSKKREQTRREISEEDMELLKAFHSYGLVRGKSIEETLVRTIRDFQLNEDTVRALRNMGKRAKRAVGPMLANLDHKSENVRVNVVDVLGYLEAPEAIEPLLGVYKSAESPTVRRVALRSLGLLKARAAMEPVIAALSAPDWWMRMEAARALGRIGNVSPPPPLLKAASDCHWKVRFYALQALVALKYQKILPLLRNALKNKNTTLRRQAVVLLGKTGKSRVFKDLKRLVADRDAVVRLLAVEALPGTGHPDAVHIIRKALKDPYHPVRMKAAAALKQLK